MTLPSSRLGVVLTVLYLAAAVYVTQDELRHTGGGWINLRGMAVALVTAPSQITFGIVLRGLGIPKVDLAAPGVAGYTELAIHILVTAMVVYLLGAGIEWVIRWGLARA